MNMLHSAGTRAVFGKETVTAASHFYETSANLMDGSSKNMGDYRGKVVCVVNVASF